MDFNSRVAAEVAELTTSQTVSLYNTIVEHAFKQCVHSFRATKLSGNEITCVENTAAKLLKHSARVQARMADAQKSFQEELRAQAEATPMTAARTPIGTRV